LVLVLLGTALAAPLHFTTDAAESTALWSVRKGIFPAVDAVRPTGTTVISVAERLFQRAGFDVVYPRGLDGLCCGQPFESKGLMAAADHTSVDAVQCCGFACERGFMRPELNEHALRHPTAALPAGCSQGYSSSRTCKIGLSEMAGRPASRSCTWWNGAPGRRSNEAVHDATAAASDGRCPCTGPAAGGGRHTGRRSEPRRTALQHALHCLPRHAGALAL
jgi:hypothetical protein